jgi:serine/threonine-protein phosphatase 5
MEGKTSAEINAENCKNEANEFFNKGKLLQALQKYTEAIELNPKVAIYWSNRAFTHLKLEEHGSVIEDATKAIEIDPTYAKAR